MAAARLVSRSSRACLILYIVDSGNTVRLADGSLLISINLYYQPGAQKIKGDGSSVALLHSDGEGLNWEWRSDVATAEEFQWSGEGPNESTLSLLSDGTTLICIIRMDAGDGHATGKPYAKRFSTDQGRSWGPLQNMSASVGTAKPRLLLMDGSLILVGGRPGNWAWLNPDGMLAGERLRRTRPRARPTLVRLCRGRSRYHARL